MYYVNPALTHQIESIAMFVSDRVNDTSDARCNQSEGAGVARRVGHISRRSERVRRVGGEFSDCIDFGMNLMLLRPIMMIVRVRALDKGHTVLDKRGRGLEQVDRIRGYILSALIKSVILF